MNNTYGNKRPSLIQPTQDVEIFYQYRPTLNSEDTSYRDFIKISDTDIVDMFTNSQISENNADSFNPDRRLPGMYNLSLPVSIFGRKGFYTLFIRPKEIQCTIKDIGSLAAYPDISGIVIDMNEVSDNRVLFSNDNLVGYRIEYLQYEENGVRRQEYYRLITSNNLASPISQNLTSSYTNANGYRFNDSGSLCFITVTPNTSPSFKANATPYIGAPNQRILISNTKFDPVCIRIEICENDFDTLATSIDGNQIRSLDNGIVTTYNKDNEIYKQWDFYTLKDNYSTNDKLEVKKQRTDNIDNSVNADEAFNA